MGGVASGIVGVSVYGGTFDLDSQQFDVTSDPRRILAQAVECRLDTAPGTYEDDPDYGYPLEDALLDDMTPETLARVPAEAAAQLRQDPAIADATATPTVRRTAAGGAELELEIGLTPRVGEPVALVLTVDQVSVDVLLRGGP